MKFVKIRRQFIDFSVFFQRGQRHFRVKRLKLRLTPTASTTCADNKEENQEEETATSQPTVKNLGFYLRMVFGEKLFNIFFF